MNCCWKVTRSVINQAYDADVTPLVQCRSFEAISADTDTGIVPIVDCDDVGV